MAATSLLPNSHHLFSRRPEIDNVAGVLVGNGRASTSGFSLDGCHPTACQSGNFCCHGAKGSDRGNVDAVLAGKNRAEGEASSSLWAGKLSSRQASQEVSSMSSWTP